MLGSGIIGSCYGALLSIQNRLILVDKKEVISKIKKRGIKIVTVSEKTFKPIAQTKIDKIPANTLLILTTKAHQTKSALQKITGKLRTDTVILILQNGLGNEDLVKKIVGNSIEVIRGIVNSGAWEIKEGCFNLILRDTVLEPSKTSKKIAQIFNQSGLPTRIAKDFTTELWQKLILNCVLNPLTAILRVKNNQIRHPILMHLRHNIIKECVNVAKAESITLPTNITKMIDKKILSYTNFSSMYYDVINHKKTEIDFLNGEIVKLAKKHNIAVPINETLISIIKFLEIKKNAT